MVPSYVHQYIWVRLSRVWGGPTLLLGILVMVPYTGTRSYVCKRAFTTSVTVSENA